MIRHRCLSSKSGSTVLAIGLLNDKGEVEVNAGVLTQTSCCSGPRGGEVDAGAPTHHHPAGDEPGRRAGDHPHPPRRRPHRGAHGADDRLSACCVALRMALRIDHFPRRGCVYGLLGLVATGAARTPVYTCAPVLLTVGPFNASHARWCKDRGAVASLSPGDAVKASAACTGHPQTRGVSLDSQRAPARCRAGLNDSEQRQHWCGERTTAGGAPSRDAR
jgi:hypothetical protein